MPQILCTSIEKPVDHETQLHCRPGLGRSSACRKYFSLVQCYGIKQYGLIALIVLRVDLQPPVSLSRFLLTLVVIVLFVLAVSAAWAKWDYLQARAVSSYLSSSVWLVPC